METHSFVPVKLPVIILAAGLSERMGQSKAFLKWDESTSFLEKIIREYSSFESKQVIIVMNQEGYQKALNELPEVINICNVVLNPNPESGRLSSLKLGINELSKGTACFVQNVDNPFITAGLLCIMNELIDPDAYVVPVFEGKGGHPVLLGSAIIDYISAFEEPDFDLHLILQKFRRIEIKTEDKQIMININTMEDYKHYFHL